MSRQPSDYEIVGGPVEVEPENGERVFSYRANLGEVIHTVLVVIPAALMDSPPVSGPAALAVATKGRSALEEWLAHRELPNRITVDASGSGWGDPQ